MRPKEAILERVRRAIGTRGPEIQVSREYRRTGTLDEASRLNQFAERLEDYNAGVYRCAEALLPQTIALAMNARSRRRMVIPPLFPGAWLPAEMEFIRDEGLSYTEIDRMEGVLTACTAAISFTGTIILSHTAQEGRRALTLIPDYHLCVVRPEQVAETVAEGFERLFEHKRGPVTTISGPSATADIEMTRIKGVHGPRTLDVILISI